MNEVLTVAHLGPNGSFSHDASIHKFGSGENISYLPQATIGDVFKAVNHEDAEIGVVPIENSIAGPVAPTLDGFLRHSTAVEVESEINLPIHHCLLANVTLTEIKTLYSHPMGFAQCQDFIETKLRKYNIVLVPCESTSEAALKAKNDAWGAAICNKVCGEIYGLNIISSCIADREDNITRFFTIIKSKTGKIKDHAKNQQEKAFVSFTVDYRKPGSLCDALMAFKNHLVNLIKIYSRPSLKESGSIVFFVECDHNEHMEKALQELSRICIQVDTF